MRNEALTAGAAPNNKKNISHIKHRLSNTLPVVTDVVEGVGPLVGTATGARVGSA